MMTREELLSMAEIIERMVKRFEEQGAEHERMMGEHRISFGARTEADAKIIAGLREESAKYKAERDHFYQREGIEQKRRMDVEDERDGLLTQVQDLRAEMERLRAQMSEQEVSVVGIINERNKAWERCDALRAEVAALQERLRASIARGDFAQMEVAALKSQNPKHPVHLEYEVVRPNGEKGRWSAKGCGPCDPPATHDTEQGKATAESAVRTDPVAEEIKVGDMAKVVGASGDLTAQSDIGKIGEVLQLDSMDGTVLLSGGAGWVDHRDVRKVTT